MSSSAGAPKATLLRGQWGTLRPLDPARDVAALYAVSHDSRVDETWAEMKVGPFSGATAFRVHLDELVADKSRAFYTIDTPDSRPVGWLCLMEVQPAHKTVELGYVVFGPALQRTTLATEAFYLIMAHIFDDLGFQRLEWTCTASNLRSRRAAERLGFRLEGIMRSKLILKGRTHDIPLFSMLAEEWPAVRAEMQRWLAPANFAEGQQITPLRVPGV